MHVIIRSLAIAAAFAFMSGTPLVAQSVEEKQQNELKAAFEAAEKVAVAGGADVKLSDQGVLHLPKGYTYVPQPEAGVVMRALGNSSQANMLGLIFPSASANWMATIKFIKEGYIKDDDAKNWNADELLKNLKDGTAAANEDRKQRGFPPLEVTRWLEQPAYDSGAHRLVWSALVRRIGASDDDGSANYNTYALGREGYFSLNLITATQSLDGYKQHAKTLLAALDYTPGKSYADFNPATDQMAAYGLAALIGGVAAKKLGFFAAIGIFLLKFWKIAALAVVGLFAFIPKLFKRRAD